jgi:hypothetical protein
MGGEGRGRKWRTEQVNWALVVRLTGEFQGFGRDLHDEASDALAARAAAGNPALELVIAAMLKSDRRLDRGNPTPDALGNDFLRFGMELWPALKAEDVRNELREKRLRALVEARNAISHSNAGGLSRLAADGYPIDLKTIRRWLSSLRGLTRNMDNVVANQIAQVVGGTRPW